MTDPVSAGANRPVADAQRRLTVLQLLPALDSGGVERGVLEVGRALVAAGHRSLVVSAGGRLVAQLEAEGSEHFTLPVAKKSPLALLQVRPLRRLLRETQPDILHLRSRLPAWLGWLAWRGLDPATRPHRVSTVHGLYSVSRYSAVMTQAERIIAVSNTVRQYLLSHYPLDPARITVIERGIDPAVFPRDYQPDAQWYRQWYRAFPETQGKRWLVLPGRLTRLKGHEAFLRLLATLSRQGFPVHGVIVGDAHPRKQRYAAEIRTLAEQLGLGDQLTFTGYRSDLNAIFAAADLVFSLSTKPEAFGRTVLEALAVGTPVVGWDHGGVGEILSVLFNAGRVPLNDETTLLARTQALLEGPVPAIAPVPFTLERMLAGTLSLYQQVAGQARAFEPVTRDS